MKRTQFLNKKKEIKSIDFAFDKIYRQLNFEVPEDKCNIPNAELRLISKQIFAHRKYLENIIKNILDVRPTEETTITKTVKFGVKTFGISIVHKLNAGKLELEVEFEVLDNNEFLNAVTHKFTFDFDKMSMDHDVDAGRKRASLLDAMRVPGRTNDIRLPYVGPNNPLDGYGPYVFPRDRGWENIELTPFDYGGTEVPDSDRLRTWTTGTSELNGITYTADINPSASGNSNAINATYSVNSAHSGYFSNRMTSISLEP